MPMKAILVASFTYLELFLLYSDIVPRQWKLAQRSEWTDKFNRFPEEKEENRLDIFFPEQ